jgi:Domain of unknown function (DUF4304)
METIEKINSVQSIFIDLMRGKNFRRSGKNWLKDNGEILSGLSLQSSWTNSKKGFGTHWVEFGCFIRELDYENKFTGKFMTVSWFHIRQRASVLFLNKEIDKIPYLQDYEKFDEQSLFNIEKIFGASSIKHFMLENESFNYDYDSRTKKISYLLSDHVLPMVNKLSTPAGILEAYENSLLPASAFIGGYGRVLPWIERQLPSK